eukprot:1474587-Pyramimonas_sp.AAC.1
MHRDGKERKPRKGKAIDLRTSHCCRKNRVGRHAKRTSKGTGRPLGYLVCWLQQYNNFASAWEHKSLCHCSWAARKAAREWLKTLPGAHVLLAQEREKLPGEDSEHEDFV